MKRAIELLTEVRHHYYEMARSYEAERAGLGHQFRMMFRNRAKQLMEWPYLGTRVNRRIRRIRLKRFPYYLFYRVYRYKVTLVAIAMQERTNGISKSFRSPAGIAKLGSNADPADFELDARASHGANIIPAVKFGCGIELRVGNRTHRINGASNLVDP